MVKFKRFFSTDSAKAIKADKYGWLNGINYMAPHTTGGIGNLCSHSSAGCRDLCLGMYSGQAAMVKDLENGINSVRASRIAKAQWFMSDRQAFMREMSHHVKLLSRKATFSLSEVNMHEAIHVLANGHNVAVVFGHGQPTRYLGHRVIDGTEHDLRHLDPSPVIVGLDPKGKKAKNDTSGFVVRDY
jgi:hypothetical protein